MKQDYSNQISAFDAKTHFSNLLQRVQNGERITILKHNTPIALLVPMPIKQVIELQEVIENMESFRKEKILGNISIKELKNCGRK